MYQLSCLYWVYASMGDYWDERILDRMELLLISKINVELKLQRKFEIERDDRTDAGLQTIRLGDILSIVSYYEKSTNL